MKRVVSVWLPDWPITVWSRAAKPPPPDGAPPDGAPFALVERGARGVVLSAVNPAARALGLRRGQTHADARAIAPALLSAPQDPQAAADALRRLALWAERYSPLISLEDTPGFEGLMLDMTGGAHLFGGEAALLAEIEARLSKAAIPARTAIADAPGAAWALARFAADPIAPPGESRAALAGLPMEALRLDESAVKLLSRFGLRAIGDLYPLPRSGLARRFRGDTAGLRVVRRLDQALGLEAEPLEGVRPPPAFRVWRTFLEPLIDVAGIEAMLPDLAAELALQLEQGGAGARSLELAAFRTDGRVTAITASLSAPARRAGHIVRLMIEKGLEQLDLGFGADALMLCAHRTAASPDRQIDLQSRAIEGEALAGLIDRLCAKLGDGAVRRPQAVASHIPERSERWVMAEPDAPAFEVLDETRLRPLLLLDPPEPVAATAEMPDAAPAQFTWRRISHRVVRAQGPERLSPEWWRASAKTPRTRDYYAVEDAEGRRFWLFREGLYDRIEADEVLEKVEGAKEDRKIAPTWWMHGVFA